jgi:hypothetical protein
MALMITRPIRLAISMAKAQEGTFPLATLIMTTIRENITMATTKIDIQETRAFGGARTMGMIWEQVLDKGDSLSFEYIR